MIQFYLLSILFNAAAGFVLLRGDSGEESSLEREFRFSLGNETFRLVLGILTMAIGLLKLLSPVQGNLPVLGDILPALAGLGAGFIILLGYYQSRSSLDDARSSKAAETVSRNRKWVGFVSLGAALLHFLFPQAFLL
ncbi:MAG: hypothetical protein LBR93_05815 [Treponema sp.]|jgi:hypothetical protein|nr:hypothetical protein [Treponema sp.]